MLLGLAAVSSICLAFTLALAPEPPAAASLSPRVRATTPAARALLETGVRRSETFARLIQELEDTDLVVYVETTPDLAPGLEGRLTFLTSAGGVRYLRAQVPVTGGVDALIAGVGHELQHALEVAAHPAVRDSVALAMLYRRIGIQGSVKDRYDTVLARSVGRRVRAELDYQASLRSMRGVTNHLS